MGLHAQNQLLVSQTDVGIPADQLRIACLKAARLNAALI
jgi:hypothetical protein